MCTRRHIQRITIIIIIKKRAQHSAQIRIYCTTELFTIIHIYIYIWLWRSRLSNAHTQSRRCLAALETCLRKFLAITLTLCSLLDVFLPATKTHCKWRNSNHIPANRRLKFTPKWNNIVMKLHFSTMYAWQDFRMTFCSEIFIKIVASCERGACVRPSCKDDQNTNFAGVFHCCCRWQFCTLDSLNVHT